MYDMQLNEYFENSAGTLLKKNIYDTVCFNNLYSHLNIIVKSIHNDEFISRQLIKVILESAAAIENQASFVVTARDNIHMADKLRYLLYIIAINEHPEMRSAGVPRII